jgi:hypothetical protein
VTEFKAFVGHSFTEDDKHLIRQFTDFFDQTHRIRPDFSWCHAEIAEPTALAKKVLALVENCNLFIAICSQKEKVLRKEISGFYARLTGKSIEFEWKTSDWIIQEIGLAIGRSIPVIILLEEGVRRPGGLQGDVEYISFTRENPNGCFGKFMEMISSLTPNDAGTPGSSSTAANAESVSDDQSAKNDDWAVPKPDWSAAKHRRFFEYAVIAKKVDLADKIENNYKELYSSDSDKQRWNVAKEYALLHNSTNGRLESIRAIADANKSDAIVQNYLALALDHFSENLPSAKVYENAAMISAGISERFEMLGYALGQYQKAGASMECERVVLMIRDLLKDRADSNALRALFYYSELAKDEILFISTAEQLLEIKPDEFDVRFKLAFQYSETGFDDLAFWHYYKIPYMDRSSTVWNNLGVSYKGFSLGGKSIRAFQKSAEFLDHSATLAMANLAGRYHDAGFDQDATRLCEDALKIANYHNNVLSKMESVRKNANDEDEREKKN